MRVFVSHSHKDSSLASSFMLALEGAGFDCWQPTSMSAGASLADQLRLAILESDLCVFLATQNSIASRWCSAELGAFWGTGKPVIVQLSDHGISSSDLPVQFEGTLKSDDARKTIAAIRSLAAQPADDLPDYMTLMEQMWKPAADRCCVVVGAYGDEAIAGFEATMLLGTGDALALASVLGAFHVLGFDGYEVRSARDFSGDHYARNLVLIGGPDANSVTNEFAPKVAGNLVLGDPRVHEIGIKDISENNYHAPKASPGSGFTDDWGIVVKAQNPFDEERFVYIIAGSFGHGSHASARFVTSKSLAKLPPQIPASSCFELLLHTQVVRGWPQPADLVAAYPL